MKIELELPDWAGDMALYILSSMELVAFKETDKKWMIKTERCHSCGKCCGLGKEGACEHLYQRDKEIWQCNYGILRPFACCVTYVPPEANEGCTEVFKELE